MEGVHVVGLGQGDLGLGDGRPPVGSRGKALVGSLGDEAPKAEAKCEITVQFFLLKI